jgi:ParB-like chromosome segregation protein Spo0J
MSKELAFHPIADIFPLMDGAEFDELVVDIKEHGQREHIRLYEGKILDGRNRYRACIAAGYKPLTASLSPESKETFDPVAYVISANIHRRHLTAEQKRELIAKLIKAAPEKSNRQIAKATGVSHPHVGKVRAEMEEAGDVETVSTSIDTRGRRQARGKAKAEPDDDRMPTEAEAEASHQETLYDHAFLILERMTSETRRRFFTDVGKRFMCSGEPRPKRKRKITAQRFDDDNSGAEPEGTAAA